jgi:hypothetical protein
MAKKTRFAFTNNYDTTLTAKAKDPTLKLEVDSEEENAELKCELLGERKKFVSQKMATEEPAEDKKDKKKKKRKASSSSDSDSDSEDKDRKKKKKHRKKKGRSSSSSSSDSDRKKKKKKDKKKKRDRSRSRSRSSSSEKKTLKYSSKKQRSERWVPPTVNPWTGKPMSDRYHKILETRR